MFGLKRDALGRWHLVLFNFALSPGAWTSEPVQLGFQIIGWSYPAEEDRPRDGGITIDVFIPCITLSLAISNWPAVRAWAERWKAYSEGEA